jgi:hypothetical protein
MPDGKPRRVRSAIWYRVMQPTLGLLWAEAAGHLARADQGVDIKLDPTPMARFGRPLRAGQVGRPWVEGTFTRRDDRMKRPGGRTRPARPPGQIVTLNHSS